MTIHDKNFFLATVGMCKSVKNTPSSFPKKVLDFMKLGNFVFIKHLSNLM